ncbi:hypothetical protein ON010_g1016 [Phytophthora cinnamomi]|nr:hypothetical protein ON010_g1016 [Phytophthora cinnamomi]
MPRETSRLVVYTTTGWGHAAVDQPMLRAFEGILKAPRTSSGLPRTRVDVLEAVGPEVDAAAPARDHHRHVLGLGQLHEVQHLAAYAVLAVFVVVLDGEGASESVRQHVVARATDLAIVQQHGQERPHVGHARNGAGVALEDTLAVHDGAAVEDQRGQPVLAAVAPVLHQRHLGTFQRDAQAAAVRRRAGPLGAAVRARAQAERGRQGQAVRGARVRGSMLPAARRVPRRRQQAGAAAHLLPAGPRGGAFVAGRRQADGGFRPIERGEAVDGACAGGRGRRTAGWERFGALRGGFNAASVVQIAGLRVAYVSGTETHGLEDEKGTLLTFSKSSTNALVQQLLASGDQGDVDFLFTAKYPTSFQLLLPEQQLPHGLQAMRGSAVIREIVQQIHPKYHITSRGGDGTRGDVFYQRLPYVSEVTGTGRKQLTRLIGLSGVNKIKDKTRKYLHALQVVPFAQQNAEERQHVDIPAGTTQNPYLHAMLEEATSRSGEPGAKRRKLDPAATGGLSAEQIEQLTAKSQGDAQFFYDQRLAAKGQRKGGLVPGDHQQRRNNRPAVPERTECWFCLSTPTLERHLIRRYVAGDGALQVGAASLLCIAGQGAAGD